jgi:hypothetical protein
MRLSSFGFSHKNNPTSSISSKSCFILIKTLLLTSILLSPSNSNISKTVKKISGHIVLENKTFNTSCSCEPLTKTEQSPDQPSSPQLTKESQTAVELVPETKSSLQTPTLDDQSNSSSDSEQTSKAQYGEDSNGSFEKKCSAGQIMITRDNDPSDQALEGVIDSHTAKDILLLDSHGTWGVPQCDSSAKNMLTLSEKVFQNVSEKSFSCIDGRVKEKGFSALGGDAGEFLLALSVFTEYSKKEINFTEDEVKRMFEIYLNKMRPKRFYMCTDQDSLKNIELAVGSSGFSLKNVRQSLKSHVLDNVVKSDNVGSVHIQKMMGRFN